MKTLNSILLCSFICLISCDTLTENEKIYVKTINEWHKKRIEKLQKKDSWLSLAGLFWLDDGENSFGSDKSNDIVFPAGKAEKYMGWFNFNNGKVTMTLKPGINITYNEKQINDLILLDDNTANPTIIKYETLSWYVIKRQDKYGIRLKDSAHPEFERFNGIDRYNVDPKWKIPARFVTYNPPKMIEIPTVLGTINKDPSPGYLEFELKGKQYRLDPTGTLNSKSLFLIFADKTNGKETYGAGRFLSVDFIHPDSTIFIDFNKAYNPPCAFSKYATCPLPPKQNQLDVEIKAGEKTYEHALH